MVETVDMFYKDIGVKEISFTSNSDSMIGEVNTNMNALYGLSNVIRGNTDKNVMKTKGMNDSLVDTRDISDTAQVAGSEDIERSDVVECTLLVSQIKSCLLESHL